MASEEVRGSFCRYDSCVITDQLATGVGTLERELLLMNTQTVGRNKEVGRFRQARLFVGRVSRQKPPLWLAATPPPPARDGRVIRCKLPPTFTTILTRVSVKVSVYVKGAGPCTRK